MARAPARAGEALTRGRGVRIGLISDTHGLIRPEALAALEGVDHILHAGDIVRPDILDTLRAMAPLTAVRGNNDYGDWADALPESTTLRFGAVKVHMRHILADMRLDPRAEGIRVVVSGHSHKPLVEERAGMLYVNPGSAGPRRFRLPVSVAELQIEGASVSARLLLLDQAGT